MNKWINAIGLIVLYIMKDKILEPKKKLWIETIVPFEMQFSDNEIKFDFHGIFTLDAAFCTRYEKWQFRHKKS